MTYKQFAASIEDKPPAPAYWFEGADVSMKKLAVERLCQAYTRLYGSCGRVEMDVSSLEGGRIVEEACQLTLARGARVLLVARAEQLGSGELEQLLEYLENPVDDTCIVFDVDKAKRTLPLRQFLEKRGGIVTFAPARPGDVVGLVRSWAEQEGKQMGYETAQRLCERVGTDVWLLRSEVEKLALFVHPGGIIHPDHVDEICGETAEVSIFKLTDAFKDKDLSRCVRLLSRLLEQGSDPAYIETMLARELRILLVLKQAKPTPTPEKACTYIFGPRKTYTHFYLRQARAYLRAAEHFNMSSLVKCYQSLARADYAFKSTSVEPFMLLEHALVVAFA